MVAIYEQNNFATSPFNKPKSVRSKVLRTEFPNVLPGLFIHVRRTIVHFVIRSAFLPLSVFPKPGLFYLLAHNCYFSTMALDDKDRQLIAANRLGKPILERMPGFNRLLDNMTKDQNVKNILVGNIVLGVIDGIFGKEDPEPAPIKRLKRNKGHE
jgi:hypothetical protein